MSLSIREQLLQLYLAGVQRVRGFSAVSEFLRTHIATGHTTDWNKIHLVAIGKAASSMCLGAIDTCNDHIEDALVITKHNHLDESLIADSRFDCFESDHPVPGENTLYAGKKLITYIKTHAQAGSQFLFLLSGGASSLVEVLPEGIALDDIKNLNVSLLSSGLDITQMNRIRCSLSRIKGGRLAYLLKDCKVLNLLISDVPGDNPAVIGSGLLTPVADVVDVAQHLPKIAQSLINNVTFIQVPDIDYFQHINTHIIACLDDAKKIVASEAKNSGFKTICTERFIAGDVTEQAQQIIRELEQTDGEIVIWGGETSMVLPVNPGRGGRNQHFALVAATEISGRDDMFLLVAGTDGTDGPTDDAGGLVDGRTIARGEAQGITDAVTCLRNADSGTFLSASGDLITTGPTGTNVMDLIIGIRHKASLR